MDLKLKGKTAFISGSSQGIGYTTALNLLKEGVTVYINGTNCLKLENAVKSLTNKISNANIFGIEGDLSNNKDLENIKNKLSKIDILINNVGIYKSQSFFNTSNEDWLKQFKVNFMSGVELSRYFLPKMIKSNWGRIIFISSECAFLVPEDMISYSTSKLALHGLSRGLSQLTSDTEVTVNTIVPGSTLTPGANKFLYEMAKKEGKTTKQVEKEFFDKVRTSSILKRFAKEDEVAKTILYMCSPLSIATNGSIIKIDGGTTGGIN